MVSLMLIWTAVFTLICGYFYLEAKDKEDSIVCFIAGISLLLISIPWFVDFLLEELEWVF
jgi:hypothetical protein